MFKLLRWNLGKRWLLSTLFCPVTLITSLPWFFLGLNLCSSISIPKVNLVQEIPSFCLYSVFVLLLIVL